jgi:RHS repeat-associated protein
MSVDVGFASQTPSLPGGGATVSGLGETFTPDLATGTGTFAVPLDLPHGPNDIGPRLTLRYATGTPNGPFGQGWTIPLPRLLRSTAGGRPAYGEADSIVLEGSGPLVRDAGDVLRPEVDNGDWRVEAAGPGYLATDRAGNRFALGMTSDSRVPGPAGTTWAWLLHEIEDNLGYTADVRWWADGAQRYLDKVSYGEYEVHFQWEARPDPLRWSAGGILVVTTQRCRSIDLHLVGAAVPLVRRWDLGYVEADPSGASLLHSVTMTGVAEDGTELSAPPLTMDYTAAGSARLVAVPAADAAAAPPPLAARGRVELVDWYGDGLPDAVEVSRSGAARVWRNEGGRWGRPRSVGELPLLAGVDSQIALTDLDGDGLADLVRVDAPAMGYQPRTADGVRRPVSWRRSPSVAFDAPWCRLADFDGDGRVDLLWSAGSSLLLAARGDDDSWSERPTRVPRSTDGPPTDLEDPHVFVADMTGDGSPDVVRIDGRGVTWWAHLGGGRFSKAVTMGSPPTLPFDVEPERLFLVDLDGDGCADLLHVAVGEVTWWPNCGGDHFGSPRTATHLPTGAMDTIRVADVLGVGSPAVCFALEALDGRVRWFALDLLGGVRPALLSTIDNGVGLLTDVAYGTSAAEAARDRGEGRTWTSRLPVVLSVVASTTATDRATGRSDVTTYRYHEGRFDPVLRELCGFGSVEQDDVGDADVPALRTTHEFHTGTLSDGSEPATAVERRRARAIRGRLRSRERATPDGRVFDRTIYAWEVADGDDPRIVVPRLRSTTVETLEGGAKPFSRIVTETLAWDADGNVTRTREQAFDGTSGPPVRTLRTRITYALDPLGRFRQRVCRVRQDDGAGTVLADAVTEYDNRPIGEVGAEGLVTARSALVLPDQLVADVYAGDVPDLPSLGYEHRSGGWWIEQARYARTVDAHGLRGTVTGPRGAVTELRFDPSGCYPVHVVDPGGNALDATYDPRVCRPVRLVDAAGATSTATYDSLARLVAQHESGDPPSNPTSAAAFDTSVVPSRVRTSRRAGSGDPHLVERQFLDGNGRTLEQRGEDAIGEVSDIATVYGRHGLPVRVHLAERPATASYSPPPATRPHVALTYDALGRVIRTVRPDGGIRRVRRESGFVEEADEESTRTDAAATHAGIMTRRHLDATGRVVRVEQVSTGGTVTTTTAYDDKGAIAEHRAANGSRTRFTRDLLGRAVRVERPEVTQIVVLDAAGNPVEERSGTARVYRVYDDLNRLREVRHDDPGNAPVIRCEYHDNGAPAPVDAGAHTAGGRLVRVDDEAGATVYDYDERGRIARKLMTPAGGSVLELDLAYRPDGRIDSVTYPVGTGGTRPVATYLYDHRGRLQGIGGVIDAITYDLTGRRTETRYANGVVEETPRDPATGWLERSTIKGPAGVLRDVDLTHDRVGNVVALTSPDPDETWSYQYDDLYRLEAATGQIGTLDYSYDDAGDLTSATGVGAFSYGAGSAPPTALTSAGGDSFEYDDRGNVTGAPWGIHTLDAEGRLRRIDLSDGGRHELTYGHTGTLARRVVFDAAGAAVAEVVTPDALVAMENGALVIQFWDGEQIVAREPVGDVRQWHHHDHLGSLVLVTSSAGSVELRIRYGPYGEELARTGPATGTAGAAGFGSGETVVPGLVLLGHRWYCPRIGRFLSPDPLVADADDPIAWNAYAYARANPTSYVDPSGRDAGKVFAMIMFALAIILVVVVVSVATWGTGTPATLAFGGITWGAVFAATMVGVVAGGVIGGIAAARARGDAEDILLGVLVGAAVGGWSAYVAAFAGPAIAGACGLYGVVGGAVAGAISGTVNGAAMGFAAGFAGGRNGDIDKVLEKMLVGAVVGLIVGTAVGALSGYASTLSEVGSSASPSSGSSSGGGSTPGPAPSPGPGPGGASPVPPPSYTNQPLQAAGTVAKGFLGKGIGEGLATYGPRAAAAVAPYVGLFTRTVAVDLMAATHAAFWDDIKHFVRTHDIDIPPVGPGGDT